MKRVLLLTTIGIVFFCGNLIAQVMNPNDPVYNYNPTDAAGSVTNPNLPATGVIAPWIRTHNRVSMSDADLQTFKCYIYNGMAYRLRFPKNYTAQPGKKFPVIVFLHGGGEIAHTIAPNTSNIPNRDNEDQLFWGASNFLINDNNGTFESFLLFAQSTSVGQNNDFDKINSVLDELVNNNRADEDRVIFMGLSIGSNGDLDYSRQYPQRVAKVIASSPSFITTFIDSIPKFLQIPLWIANGGKDPNPDSVSVKTFVSAFTNQGGNIIQSFYKNNDHNTWSDMWNESRFIPQLNSAHKANPLVYYGRTDFCPDSTIVARLALTPGFYAYQWDKNGVILDSVRNELYPNAYGTYRARFKRTINSAWSDWSPTPVVIAQKQSTLTPPITTTGIKSRVLPALDGSTSTPLELPTGYVEYQWRRVSDNVIISSSRTYVAAVGQYKATVKEQYGCNATFSPIFNVVDANGPNKPDKAKNLSAISVGGDSVLVSWNKNASSVNPTVNFELYRSTAPGGPYTLVGITDVNTLAFTDKGLQTNVNYYYVVRAVNETGAADKSNEASVLTKKDIIAPTAPSNLKVIFQTREYVELAWDPSTDNVGIFKYDIYVNGQKSYSADSSLNTFKVYNLAQQQYFNFFVKARDKAGNVSAASNQVTGGTFYSGLKYRYFEGSYDALPNFDNLIPVKSSTTPNIDISIRNTGVNDYFAFVWEGYLIIPSGQGGSYQFRTTSDDGSNLYLNSFYSSTATPIVNNDGLHGSQTITSSSITLNPGGYKIAATFFEKNGGEVMTVEFKGPSTGNAWVVMRNSDFQETGSLSGTIPTAPSLLKATATAYNKISLSWLDNSNNETGFEITRSTSLSGTFLPVATTAANATSFIDSNLQAQTKYFYQIRAVGTAGESVFEWNTTDVNWKLNNTLADEGGDATRLLTGTNTSFTTSNKQEGTHALSFAAGYAAVNNSTSGGFPSNAYSQRSIALWIRPGAVNTKQMIFDFGGSDNGLALRIDATGKLTAGIASASSRTTITSPSAISANTWTHVAVVYNISSLKLFVNGVEAVANNALSISTINASANAARLGAPSGTAAIDNSFSDGAAYTNFSGQMDDIYIISTPLIANEVAATSTNTYGQSNATTSVLPSAPTAPTLLARQIISTKQINLSWQDNANNETGFEIYRSTNNNSNYQLLKTTLNNVTSYQDTSCFANVTYYYKVRAIIVDNTSAYSNEVFGKTNNTVPVFTDVADFTIKFGTSLVVPILATDADNDDMTFTYKTLPKFATITNTGNGTANLTLTPQSIHQGTYKLTFYVADPNGGKDTTKFVLVVNSNTLPTLNTINNVSVNEGSSTTANLTATDPESQANLKYTFQNLPSFANFVDNGNGNGTLTITPGYAASGTYAVTAIVDDGFGAWSSKNFTITVGDVSPNTSWKVNIKENSSSNFGPAPWNNMTGASITNLVNTKSQVTPVAISTNPGYYFDIISGYGQTTSNNSGYYPDAVLSDVMALQSPLDTMTFTVSGLDPALVYNFRFMSSTVSPGETLNSKTGFRIGSKRDSIAVKGNTAKTAYITGAQPNASGNIDIKMYRSNSQTAWLNGLEIEALYADGTLPSKALNLTGAFTPGNGIKLTWKDIAYNEKSYFVYRSTVKTGPYTLLNPSAINPNDTSYNDLGVNAFSSYYYYVIASNSFGTSPSSDTVNVSTTNNPPVISAISDLYVVANNSNSLNFIVSDDAGDALTVTPGTFPAFATLIPMGGNAYSITANPTVYDAGIYYSSVTVTDDKGSATTSKFKIIVSDNKVKTVLINFGKDGYAVAAPWNNLVGPYPSAVSNKQNLIDNKNSTTNFGITLGSFDYGFMTEGFSTNNNSGIVPDSVLMSGIQEGSTTPRTITLNGLDQTKKYSIGFVSSVNGGKSATTTFTSGAQSVTTEARYNSNVDGRLNGLVPNASGIITVTVTKPGANTWNAYLNAIIINEYDPAVGQTPILSPSNLYAEPKSRTSVALTWSDRSDNETGGFEIYRATAAAGPFTLLVTTAVSATQYTDATAAENTRYYYKVRAKGASSTFSDYSNTASTITPNGITNINFTTSTQNGGIWNNTGKTPATGDVFSSFKNEQLAQTGFSLSIVNNFNGAGNVGQTTGNNSGVVPDTVLNSSYTLTPYNIATVKLTGLDQSKRYRIGYVSTLANSWDFSNTTMTIGSRSATINGIWNTSKVLYIGDVQPDENGEVLVNFSIPVSTVNPNTGGYVGGLIVQGYTDAAVNGGTVLNIAPPIVNNELLRTNTQQIPVELKNISNIKVYPNPFEDRIMLDINNSTTINTLQFQLYDISGRQIMHNNQSGLIAGSNKLQLNLSEYNLLPGNYFLKVFVNGQPASTVKLVKAKR